MSHLFFTLIELKYLEIEEEIDYTRLKILYIVFFRANDWRDIEKVIFFKPLTLLPGVGTKMPQEGKK